MEKRKKKKKSFRKEIIQIITKEMKKISRESEREK